MYLTPKKQCWDKNKSKFCMCIENTESLFILHAYRILALIINFFFHSIAFERQVIPVTEVNPLVPNPIYTWRRIMIFTIWGC